MHGSPIFLPGGWDQVHSFLHGVQIVDSIWNWFFGPDGRIFRGVFILIYFLWAVWRLIHQEWKPVFSAVMITVYLSFMAFGTAISMPTPGMAASLTTTMNQAQSRVSNAQAALASAQKAGVGVAAAQKQLGAARSDLARLKKLQADASGSSIDMPTGLYLAMLPVQALFAGIWDATNAVHLKHLISPQNRQVQAYMAAQLAATPKLSPAEQAVAQQLSQCLLAKQSYIEQAATVAGYVKQGLQVSSTQNPPLTGKKLAAAWAKVLLPSRTAARKQCHDESKSVAKVIDASITPADVKQFEGGFTIHGHSFFKTTKADKINYIAATLGVPASDVSGKSPDQITKMYLRERKFAALSKQLTSDIGQVGAGAAGTAFNSPGGVAAKGASTITNIVGSLGLIAKNAIIGGLNWLLYLLPIAFFFVLIMSLIPRMWPKAWGGLILGIFFLYSWQYMIGLIESYTAATNQQQVAMQVPPSGSISYMADIAEGTWSQLTGGAETGKVVATGAVVAVARRKLATSKIGEKVIAKALEYGADAGPEGLAISGTIAAVAGTVTAGTAAYAANQTLDKNAQNFSNVMLKDGGMNPALEAVAGGMIERQRAEIQDAQSQSALLESILYGFSGAFTAMMALGAWFMAGGLGLGSKADQMGTQLGSSVFNWGAGKLGRMGGAKP